MGTSDPARQFIMIPFLELDSPRFMLLARSPEFSTYLTLRRHIWRSREPHSRHLQRWYAAGYLCCGLSVKAIARRTRSNMDERTVRRDIRRLLRRKVIEAAGVRENRVLVLGRWEERDGTVVEHYYLERLKKTVESDPAQEAREDTEWRV